MKKEFKKSKEYINRNKKYKCEIMNKINELTKEQQKNI